jgi:subtilisin family serine protease
LLIFIVFVEIWTMRKIFNQIQYLVGVSLLGSFCLMACGRGAPGFMEEPPSQIPPVRLAGSGQENKAEYRPGSYLVMFRESGANSNLYFSSFADEYSHHYNKLSDQFLTDARIKDIDVLSAVDMTGLRSVEWEPEFSLPKAISYAFSSDDTDGAAGVLARVDFEDEIAAAAVLGEWESDSRIWFAEPNEISRLSEDAASLAQLSKDYANKQFWHKQIRVPEAFAALAAESSGAADVYADPPVIAVLDSGVDYEHPQLKDNIWVNTQVGAAGCVDDIHGCNTAKASKGRLGNGDVWPVLADGPGQECDPGNAGAISKKCDHGTHVAGIIAAKPLASSYVAGVCPMCKIMILRVTEVEGGGTSGDPMILDDSQIRAYKYLARFRKSGGSAVRLVNASFGKYSRSRSLSILIDVLKRVGSGTLLIGAASNEDSMIRSYPAALANAIAVASVGARHNDPSVRKSNFSNFGPWVDIAAPGFIDSTVSGGASRVMPGTSMASPVVAGSAGLLLAAYPKLSFLELRDRIIKGASAARLYGSDADGGSINSQYYYPKIAGEFARRPLLGGGLVDAEAMVKGSGNFATGQPVERVTAGCGVIGIGTSGGRQVGWLVAFLILPLLLSLFRFGGRRG